MKTEMLKGHLDMIVLAALEAGPSHGYAVIETIRHRSGGGFDLPEGTVYPALHRLEELQLLSSCWETSPLGRQRRVYSITKRGKEALLDRQASWIRFAKAISAVLGGARALAD